MPIFVEIASGQEVDATTATFWGGKTKPGFQSIAADGERIGFDISARDSATPTPDRLFVRDDMAARDQARNEYIERLSGAVPRETGNQPTAGGSISISAHDASQMRTDAREQYIQRLGSPNTNDRHPSFGRVSPALKR